MKELDCDTKSENELDCDKRHESFLDVKLKKNQSIKTQVNSEIELECVSEFLDVKLKKIPRIKTPVKPNQGIKTPVKSKTFKNPKKLKSQDLKNKISSESISIVKRPVFE